MNKPELLKCIQEGKVLLNECDDEHAALVVQIRIANALEGLSRHVHAIRIAIEKIEKAEK